MQRVVARLKSIRHIAGFCSEGVRETSEGETRSLKRLRPEKQLTEPA